MSPLTAHTEQIAEELAQRHGFSSDAVGHMMRAVDAGWGGMAAFDHPEFGGPGQWMQGGMIMLGEPLNHSLRARVDALCNEIAGVYEAEGPLIERGPNSAPAWPESLGTPSATGSQGGLHYAWFAERRRLVLIQHGRMRIFDTGDHRVSGIAQQQDDVHGNVRFISQHGTIDLASLTPVDDPVAGPDAPSTETPSARADNDIFAAIERLGELRDRGLITGEEFSAKKTELLSRL
ncbi:SHOCT domain-containing protein [Salinisphaera sp.]|uniref:SHOCT domain-containing protein n=1 Tax=Salinisphaera sp. TaxID=1914330 RepID=UPI002D78DFE1|nr:SHOCT domain-containing protein [Salinisphaera sp.]HET7313403.1 SHOCT domain-containing protein [Salinisphaera sp.]